MKISNSTRVKVLAKSSRTSNDGKTYYQIAIMNGAEAGNLPCTEEVYNEVSEMCDYSLETVYDTDYKYFRAIHVLQNLSPVKSPAQSPAGQPDVQKK